MTSLCWSLASSGLAVHPLTSRQWELPPLPELPAVTPPTEGQFISQGYCYRVKSSKLRSASISGEPIRQRVRGNAGVFRDLHISFLGVLNHSAQLVDDWVFVLERIRSIQSNRSLFSHSCSCPSVVISPRRRRQWFLFSLARHQRSFCQGRSYRRSCCICVL